MDKALFAGGCFWCTEAAFAEVKGVLKAISGYSGGDISSANYEQVSTGKTNHFECLYIEFNPSIINYDQLLDIFWQTIDPFDDGGQFYDKGSQYKTAIFYYNITQQQIAEKSKAYYSKKLAKEIKTKILQASHFDPAEDYHQKYYKNNSNHYKSYSSHREDKLKAIWK